MEAVRVKVPLRTGPESMDMTEWRWTGSGTFQNPLCHLRASRLIAFLIGVQIITAGLTLTSGSAKEFDADKKGDKPGCTQILSGHITIRNDAGT
jgi:hypothetical protein